MNDFNFIYDNDILDTRARLFGSLLLFTQVFFKLRTNRDFIISEPIARESHHLIICRELSAAIRGETDNLLINVSPGDGKSELVKNAIAWCIARWPDSKHLYISYSHELAREHTYDIKQIIQLPEYRRIFGIEIASDSKAKDNFKTNFGGSVTAFGSQGAITGRDAGMPNLENRHSGAVWMDDMHKPDEVFSDTIRQGVIDNYNQTIKPRRRGPKVPFIFIGQRLHEDDLPAFLIEGGDGNQWKTVIIPAIDAAGNVSNPRVHPKEMLMIEKEKNAYVFSSQYQQTPLPAGGGIFRPDDFVLLDHDPEMISTFITVDTAETDKDYNDKTVFSFWGLYKIKQFNIETEIFGLHWIDCVELQIEPKDLRSEFLSFYGNCMGYPVKPYLAAIEKKSTGVTLLSVLKEMQGLRIYDIERTRASGNKTKRFFEAQEFVATGKISLRRYSRHMKMCIDHCSKITANDSHRWDDIADTLYDAVKIGLIDCIVPRGTPDQIIRNPNLHAITRRANDLQRLKGQSQWQR